MTSPTLEARPAGFERRPPMPWLRWSLLSLLLIAEPAVLAARFSMYNMAGADDWQVRLLRGTQPMFRLILGVGFPAVLFGGPGLFAAWRRLGSRLYPPALTWGVVLGNLAAFAAFYRLAERVVEGGVLSSPSSGAWLAVWALTGVAALAFWAAAVVPVELWAALAGRFFGALGVGAVVCAAALAASSRSTEWWSNSLRVPTFWAVRGLLIPFCPRLVYEPESFTIGPPEFTEQIAPKCSGYEGIGLIWVITTAYLVINRRSLRFPQALLLFPVGTVTIWAANAVRIAALILLGAWYSPELAEGAFHSLAGWFGLNVVAVGVMLLSRRLRFFRADAPSATENPTAPYLVPVLALIAAGMIAGAFSAGGFDRYYPACVAATLAAFWPFRRRYAAMGLGTGSGSRFAVAVGALTFVGWMALEPYHRGSAGPDTATPAALAGMSRAAALVWLAARVFGSVVTVPLAEELAFRGFLTRRLIAADFQEVPPGRFTWPSFLGSSLAFGLLHQRWLAGTLAGMAYALVYFRRGRLGDPVLAHATTNALIAAWVLTSGDWSTWS